MTDERTGVKQNMNSLELLCAAVNREKTERTPCVCPGGMMNMLTADMMERCSASWPKAHVDAGEMAKLAAFPYENGLFDNIGVPFCMTVEAESLGATVDLGDRYTEPRVSQYAISSVSDWQLLKPMALDRGRPETVLKAIRLLAASYPDAAIIGNLTGPVSTAASAVNADLFYRELRKKKEDAHSLMNFITEQLLSFGRAQIEAGADFIAISDPSGTGEILGPRLFEEYALPALNRLCRELRPLCCGVIVHICGQLRSIYPQLSRLECSALSVDAIVSVRELRENIPEKPIMGNVSTFALANGDEKVIRSLCRRSIDSGVNILAPACGLGTSSLMSSIGLMMRCAKEAAEEQHDD